jgi:hypothetical protein
MSNECPKCNSTNRDGAKFCLKCRSPLSASAQSQTHQGAENFQSSRPAVESNSESALYPPDPPKPADAQEGAVPSEIDGILCASCNAINRKGAKFCQKCRSTLVTSASAEEILDYVGLSSVRAELDWIFEKIQEKKQEDNNLKEVKKILLFQSNTKTKKNNVAKNNTKKLLKSGLKKKKKNCHQMGT